MEDSHSKYKKIKDIYKVTETVMASSYYEACNKTLGE